MVVCIANWLDGWKGEEVTCSHSEMNKNELAASIEYIGHCNNDEATSDTAIGSLVDGSRQLMSAEDGRGLIFRECFNVRWFYHRLHQRCDNRWSVKVSKKWLRLIEQLKNNVLCSHYVRSAPSSDDSRHGTPVSYLRKQKFIKSMSILIIILIIIIIDKKKRNNICVYGRNAETWFWNVNR